MKEHQELSPALTISSAAVNIDSTAFKSFTFPKKSLPCFCKSCKS